MKRKCAGCRASGRAFWNEPACLLGYRTGKYFKGELELKKPLEECPKPLTIAAFETAPHKGGKRAKRNSRR